MCCGQQVSISLIDLVRPCLQNKLMSIKLMTLVRHKQCMKYWVHTCTVAGTFPMCRPHYRALVAGNKHTWVVLFTGYLVFENYHIQRAILLFIEVNQGFFMIQNLHVMQGYV